MDLTASPKMEFVFELTATIGPPIGLGSSSIGIRRTVPITGGTFSGPLLSGRVPSAELTGKLSKAMV